jgi:hypothetical protein
MPIEALVWSLMMVLGPGIAYHIWPRLRSRLSELPFDLEALGPWIHGLGLPYLALILGSVSGRQVGLQDIPIDRWFTGLIAGALGLAAAYGLKQRLSTRSDPEQHLAGLFLEECRWAFYRAAAALWLPFHFSALLGLGAALLEAAITHLSHHAFKLPAPSQWKIIMRAAFSTTIFIFTRNFYLTAGIQLLLAGVLDRQPQDAEDT